MRQLLDYTGMFFININYLSICFIPVCVFLLGLTYAKTKVDYSSNYLLLLIIPVITTILIWTNEYHHLFFVNYSNYSREAVYGSYYYFHSAYSYGLIFAGAYFLFSSALKNSGFFSWQSTMLLLGILFPLTFNILYSFNIANLTFYISSVSFTFTEIFFAIAIFKFDFLNISPIALRVVMDRISDSFAVINDKDVIIDFNMPMGSLFSKNASIKRNDDLFSELKKSDFFDEGNLHKLESTIKNVHETHQTIIYETHFASQGFDKYFTVETTPIISKEDYLGTIILFKDVTQNVKNIATIKEKHAVMMEQERLASLGQLIGGIAHNLKTPIMSISGAVEALKDLTEEYERSAGDNEVTVEDHHEIASEMDSWLNKIKPYCSYMTDIIDTVKGQAMQFNAASELSFTVSELVKRIDLLMKYELIRYNCTLNTIINVNSNTELYGDINGLIQVFDNIIMNAIQAYEKKNGIIDFTIEDHKDSILFTIRDYAKGIPESIKNRLLKEMVTTKGKDGTGLGLYMSHSTIKARFGGKMWFESEEGTGTTFYIEIPYKNNNKIIGIFEGGLEEDEEKIGIYN
jgi:signal transduction histidine kinase